MSYVVCDHHIAPDIFSHPRLAVRYLPFYLPKSLWKEELSWVRRRIPLPACSSQQNHMYRSLSLGWQIGVPASVGVAPPGSREKPKRRLQKGARPCLVPPLWVAPPGSREKRKRGLQKGARPCLVPPLR